MAFIDKFILYLLLSTGKVCNIQTNKQTLLGRLYPIFNTLWPATNSPSSLIKKVNNRQLGAISFVSKKE